MKPTRSILLAEEDAAARAFLADNLTADGYEVLLAENRPAALSVLEARQPDLVVCDVNGETLGLLDAVRHGDGVAARVDPDTPLIVLTARGDELARRALLRARLRRRDRQAVLLPGAARPRPRRCCAAPTTSRPPAACASGRSRSTRPAARCAATASS